MDLKRTKRGKNKIIGINVMNFILAFHRGMRRTHTDMQIKRQMIDLTYKCNREFSNNEINKKTQESYKLSLMTKY